MQQVIVLDERNKDKGIYRDTEINWEPKKNVPFKIGSQIDNWQDKNCNRCKKGVDFARIHRFECSIQAHIITFLRIGKVSGSIAKRMGYDENNIRYTWNCPEKKN